MLFLVLGFIGLILPVIPTTPFLIVAAWAASKGSPKIHAWLYEHKYFGPVLVAWTARGAVPRKAKWLAGFMMATSWCFMFFIGIRAVVLGVMATIFIVTLTFVVTRPDA